MKKLIIPIIVLFVIALSVISAPVLGKTLSKWRSLDQQVSPGCCQAGEVAAEPTVTTTATAVVEDEIPSCCVPAEDAPLDVTQTPVVTGPVVGTSTADCCD